MPDAKKILVVEPDLAERARIVAMLRSVGDAIPGGVQLHELGNGSEAEAWLEHDDAALIVCEVLLEGTSGLVLLRRALERKQDKAPLFVFVTSMARESDRYWGLRNGAYAYVMKPYDDELLRRRLTRALTSSGPATPERP